jgi:tetratricopeptide (TPR) repeat protein
MPPPIRKYDAFGFPIPATFDDLLMPDRDATSQPARSKSATSNTPATRRAGRKKRIILGLILLGIVVLAAVPWLKDVGQGLLGDWLAQRARQKFDDGDMPGTVADSTRAFSLLGDQLHDDRRIELLAIRACAKMEIHDLEGSLADFDRVLTSPKTNRGMRVRCFLHRSWVHCRLKNYAAGVDDASSAIQLYGHDDAVLLNQRAYIRALANAEKQDKQELEAGLQDVERALSLSPDKAAFIDTKGYLLHLLGQYADALREMKRAIELTEAVQRMYHAEGAQQLRENLAVMYYHRGLIHEALGQKDEAIDDFQRAEENGYNPDAGVL